MTRESSFPGASCCTGAILSITPSFRKNSRIFSLRAHSFFLENKDLCTKRRTLFPLTIIILYIYISNKGFEDYRSSTQPKHHCKLQELLTQKYKSPTCGPAPGYDGTSFCISCAFVFFFCEDSPYNDDWVSNSAANSDVADEL